MLHAPGLLIDGEWVEPGGGWIDHVNPATGTPEARVPIADSNDVQRAVASSRQAFGKWSALRHSERRDLLMALAGRVRESAAEFDRIAAMESGTPISVGSGVGKTAEYFAYYAGWADKICGEVVPSFPASGTDLVLVEPYGVIAAIIPWNGPISSIGVKVPAALAAGNSVVLKPSELAPFAALRFGELCLEVGLPPGLVNVVPAQIDGSRALVRDPGVDKLSFTGSPASARAIVEDSSLNLVPGVFELGGKAPCIVFDDADVDRVVNVVAAFGLFALAGQGCSLPTRLIVARSRYAEVVERVAERARSCRIGNPLDADTQMGPVINASARDRILAMVSRAVGSGAGSLTCGGAAIGGERAGGFYVEPTLLVDVDPESEVAQQEVFGPVLVAMPFDEPDEAISLANQTRYGLGGSLYSNDPRQILRTVSALRAGNISVNTFASSLPAAPFGGSGESGYGREGGRWGLDEFLRTKNVFIAD